jgi:hypothetical protein
MSGETEREPSGWSVDQLKQHYDALFAAVDARYTERFVAQEKAIDKAETANEKRFDEIRERFITVNEFRGTLTDQATMLMPRAETAALIVALDEKVTAGLRALDDKVDTLREQVKTSAAHGAGVGAAWGYLVGAIGTVGGVIAIIIALSR